MNFGEDGKVLYECLTAGCPCVIMIINPVRVNGENELKKRTSAADAALAALEKREAKYLDKRIRTAIPPHHRLLDEKLPPKLKDTLRGAFLHAFDAVFSGGGIIDRTIPRQKHTTTYEIRRYTAELQPTKRSFRAFTDDAKKIRCANTFFSGSVGTAMGLFGIGLPDIPVFVGFVLRTIRETALTNGFDCNTPGEQYFMLLLIEAALACGENARACENTVNAWITAHRAIPAAAQKPSVLADQLQRTAFALSDAVIYDKFIQGIPIVGAAGGISDAVCVSQIGTYAAYKYERRRLMTPKNESEDHV